MYFSFLKFFTVSYHIPCPRVCVSHFTRISVFLSIFHALLCEFLLFLDVSFLAIFQVLHCPIFIFQFFQCFSPYSSSYSVCVSISTFLSFLAKIQVLQPVFLNISRIPLFFVTFQLLQWELLILNIFQWFSP